MTKAKTIIKCRVCGSANTKKNGYNRYGSLQYYCHDCKVRKVLNPKKLNYSEGKLPFKFFIFFYFFIFLMACSCPTPTTEPDPKMPSTNIVGTDSNDVLTGTDMGDVINALAGNDVIQAGGGDDFINGGTGDDFVDGGEGADTVIYTEPGDFTVIPTNLGGDSNGYRFESSAHGADVLLNIENIQLSEMDDVLSGYVSMISNIHINAGEGSNVLHLADSGVILLGNAHSGFEIIIGGGGADNIFGTEQAETISGGAGVDTIHAGGGNDIVNGVIAGETVSGGGGNDTLHLANSGVTLNSNAHSGFETINGGSGADFIFGTDADETITGGEGIDTIHAGGGDDVIRVNFQSNETIDGGEGRDTLMIIENASILVNLSSNIINVNITFFKLDVPKNSFFSRSFSETGKITNSNIASSIQNIESVEQDRNIVDLTVNASHYVFGSDSSEYIALDDVNFTGHGGDDVFYVVPRSGAKSLSIRFYDFRNDITGNNNDILDFARFVPEATIDNIGFNFSGDDVLFSYQTIGTNYIVFLDDILTSNAPLSSYTNRDVETFRSDLKNGTGGLTGDNACRNFFRFADMTGCP